MPKPLAELREQLLIEWGLIEGRDIRHIALFPQNPAQFADDSRRVQFLQSEQNQFAPGKIPPVESLAIVPVVLSDGMQKFLALARSHGNLAGHAGA